MLGHVDGKPFRTEVTLLPETRIIEWEGQRVETLVSQYNAYLGGRIEEVAYDYYAQADDGSVWYFGEDVFDFRDGAIVVTEGTWLAGRDGPAAMIMPGDPQIGDVYRTENAPGFVFEEVTVRSVDQQLDGPMGPIDGGLLADELHSDGTTEQKIFAPGYGSSTRPGVATSRPSPSRCRRTRSPRRCRRSSRLCPAARSTCSTRPGRGIGRLRPRWFATWRPPGTPFGGGNVRRLIEPRMEEALARARTKPSGPVRPPRPAVAAIRPLARASISSCHTDRRPRSTSPGWICGPRSCWWTRRPASPGGSAPTRSRSITFGTGSARPWMPVTSPGSTRSSERSRSPWWTRISPWRPPPPNGCGARSRNCNHRCDAR